jgi:hypothetical protein
MGQWSIDRHYRQTDCDKTKPKNCLKEQDKRAMLNHYPKYMEQVSSTLGNKHFEI